MKKILDIKLPSDYTKVSVDNIWKCIFYIAKTGKTFNIEQLIQSGMTPKGGDNVNRILSYLKFLSIVEEQRGKGDQKFILAKNERVNSIVYELKAGRKEEALKLFSAHMHDHSLYTLIKEHFFEKEASRTFNELEHFLKSSQPGKDPTYYQKGGLFIMKLLQFVDLVAIHDNDLTLRESASNSGILDPENKEPDTEAQSGMSMATVVEGIEPLKNANNPMYIDFQEEKLAVIKYNVRIITPNSNHIIEVQESEDIDIEIMLLNKIKKEINNGV